MERGTKRCSLKANIPSSFAFSLFWPSELVSSTFGHHQLSAFAWKLAFPKIIVYLLVAIATGISTISFQTLTENRFLTPSILGIESFYVLLQTLLLVFESKISSAWKVSYLRIFNLTSCPIPLLSRLTRLLEDTDETRPGLHPANLSSTRKSLSKYQYLPPSPDGSK